MQRQRGGRTRLQKNAPYETVRVAKRVYVGNLSWQVSWQDLKDHFRQAGEVVYADVMTEGGQSGVGRSKGCGIVEFAEPSEAKWAIENLNDTEIAGRNIFIREDREDRDLFNQTSGGKGGSKGGGGKGSSGANGTKGSKLYVGNLSWSTSWQDLKDVFAEYGNVNFVEIIEKDHFRSAGEVAFAEVMTEGGRSNGRSKGCGIVEFSNAAEAQKAIQELNDTMLNGRQIYVREDREQ